MYADQQLARSPHSFRKARSFEPLYTGGAVAFTPDGQWAITTLGEEAVVTEIETGVEIARILGVGRRPAFHAHALLLQLTSPPFRL